MNPTLQIKVPWQLALKVSAIGLVGWLAMYYGFPSLRPHLDEEHHAAENATAALLGLTFVLGIIQAFRCSKKSERLLALSVGFFAGIGFADETSVGEGFYQSTVPMIGETRIDGVHDLIQVVWDQKWAVVLIVVAVAWFGWRHRRFLMEKARIASASPPLAALILAAIFIALAQFFDLHIIEFAARHAVEEYFELIAAITLCLFMVALGKYGLPDQPATAHAN